MVNHMHFSLQKIIPNFSASKIDFYSTFMMRIQFLPLNQIRITGELSPPVLSLPLFKIVYCKLSFKNFS